MAKKIKKLVMALSTVLPSKLRVVIYRLLGNKIGKRVTIPPLAILIADEIKIDDYAQIRPLTLINVKRIEMGRYSIIASLSVVFGDKGLIMAERSRVGHANILDCSEDISLGHYCGLGPRNTLYTHASWLPITMGFPNFRKPIKLGNYIWTGIGVTIFPGTVVEDYVFTHANMVLSRTIKGNCFLTSDKSLPLEKILKPFTQEEAIKRIITFISEEINVYCNDNLKVGESLEKADIAIMLTFNKPLIEKAHKLKKPILTFMPKINDEMIKKFDDLEVDWYDFDRIIMSSMYHKFKNIVSRKLATWGGLRFLEKRSS